MSADFVLDTGALVALQRDRSRLRALVRLAHEEGRVLRTSAPVITEFLGHSPRRARPTGEYVISQLTASDVSVPLARRAAALIQAVLDEGGRARPSEIDALVASEAETSGAALVFDGDRRDFEALASASADVEISELRGLV
jgi:predicted nucleic acid-binding protein